MIPDVRLRGILEIAAAILLGLLSVATTASAFQASVWAQQSGEYTSIAGQLRDESFSKHILSGLATDDDGRRLAQATQLEFQAQNGYGDADQLRSQAATLVRGGTPGLAQDFDTWVASGFDPALHPLNSRTHIAANDAPIYGANRASAVAYALADSLSARSLQLTIAAVFFALALLLVGVAGANDSVKVMFGLNLGGALAFLGGITLTVLAAIG
ncbi:MAG: hypothetical protein ABIR17_11910 [Pseudolysinimonas sp.]|uniref:hypothetical protein n=1 Tax=Pseudolysinimonas sp. TaxID=2680009 RepID=UPI003266AF1C